MVLAKPKNRKVLNTFELSGKVAAVTGGARGIGLEVCRAFAEAGADVAIIYSATPNAELVAQEIASANRVTCKAYKSDVKQASTIQQTIETIAQDFKKLDIVVANAGIATHYPAEDYTEEQWSNIMKVNLDGAFYTAQAASRIFKEQCSGNIIFTASVSAILVNIPQRQAAYNASKAGLVHLSKCLAVEWIDFCRVNCISPGFIATDMLDVHPKEWRDQWFGMIPAQRLCDPYELKGAYVFCASDASSYMTGANIVIDGAYTLP